ncbi:CdaR family protein [Pedobacter montanisoli]|uniref:YbbR-like domain-containing protein n=1 Tax=Pedobacter montanisoli TaxID=2923277 RepID=A0ABS9ZW88_9SPHI|nr:YbbR-like domain-containing protein [Pedobacter montanisoli]MCJ0742569.1 YbbR-like domain-containing protein [Pedobacter montanisoli]
MPFIKLTKPERKRFGIMLVCVVLAVMAWLFMALNRKYPYTVKTELIYKDEPQGKAFKALQPDTVDLKVEGTGWQLLFSRLRIKPQSIKVSLRKLNNRNYVLFSEQLEQINGQLETSQRVISIKPDTLYFDFSKRTTKRVPVKLNSKLGFALQYGVAGNVELTPAFVNISGPHEELQKIASWYTDTLKTTGIDNSVETRINLKQSTTNNINIYPKAVGVKIPVDEFTEKVLDIPLTVINNNSFYTIKLYPKRVKITFLVALSSYKQIDEDFIQASVDLNEWRNSGHNNLRVKLIRFPAYCKLISIVPQKVDFIIEK